ncbi:hypothetical protein RRG08_017295 [Elysia crispata]|uniref:Uncharacterized protein n=1 Tax=Elysia crispata TaxID=231223 RepID=A0AAE0Y9C7_9GAST|nr:hypothetical protein RRG08_017295 [Elysia crispata]
MAVELSVAGLVLAAALLYTATVNGSYINNWDEPLLFACHNGQVMRSIHSVHSNSAEDRRWRFTCGSAPSGASPTQGCHWTGYTNAWDEPVSFMCPEDHVIVGIQSYHDNHRYRTFSCGLSQYLNEWDRPLDYTVGSDKVLVGWTTAHSNRREDCCHKFLACSYAHIYLHRYLFYPQRPSPQVPGVLLRSGLSTPILVLSTETVATSSWRVPTLRCIYTESCSIHRDRRHKFLACSYAQVYLHRYLFYPQRPSPQVPGVLLRSDLSTLILNLSTETVVTSSWRAPTLRSIYTDTCFIHRDRRHKFLACSYAQRPSSQVPGVFLRSGLSTPILVLSTETVATSSWRAPTLRFIYTESCSIYRDRRHKFLACSYAQVYLHRFLFHPQRPSPQVPGVLLRSDLSTLILNLSTETVVTSSWRAPTLRSIYTDSCSIHRDRRHKFLACSYAQIYLH